jgi:hypothetical protein
MAKLLVSKDNEKAENKGQDGLKWGNREKKRAAGLFFFSCFYLTYGPKTIAI